MKVIKKVAENIYNSYQGTINIRLAQPLFLKKKPRSYLQFGNRQLCLPFVISQINPKKPQKTF